MYVSLNFLISLPPRAPIAPHSGQAAQHCLGSQAAQIYISGQAAQTYLSGLAAQKLLSGEAAQTYTTQRPSRSN